jgi:hypothetical protein
MSGKQGVTVAQVSVQYKVYSYQSLSSQEDASTNHIVEQRPLAAVQA